MYIAKAVAPASSGPPLQQPVRPARSARPGPAQPGPPTAATASCNSVHLYLFLARLRSCLGSTLKPLSAVAPRTLAATVQMDAKGKGGKGKGGKGKPAWARQVRPATFGVAVALKWNFNTGPRGVRPQIEL